MLYEKQRGVGWNLSFAFTWSHRAEWVTCAHVPRAAVSGPVGVRRSGSPEASEKQLVFLTPPAVPFLPWVLGAHYHGNTPQEPSVHPGDPFCPRCFCMHQQEMGESTPANVRCFLAWPPTSLCSGILACEPNPGNTQHCRDPGKEHTVWPALEGMRACGPVWLSPGMGNLKPRTTALSSELFLL